MYFIFQGKSFFGCFGSVIRNCILMFFLQILIVPVTAFGSGTVQNNEKVNTQIHANNTYSSLKNDMEKNKGFDHKVLDDVLQATVFKVREGRGTLVDYQKLKKLKPALDQYLESVSRVDGFYFDEWSADEQLAFLINVYNAKTLEMVVSKYPHLESIKELGSFFQSVWSKEVIELFLKDRSLDEIEHEMIRGEENFKKYKNDPRIHFAVNCASISCPGLYERAYTGPLLQEQLDLMTKRFLSDRENNRLSSGVLKLSKIFDWYGEDFTKGWQGIEKLEDFLVKYDQSLGLSKLQVQNLRDQKIGIEFNRYDWSLNDGRSP